MSKFWNFVGISDEEVELRIEGEIISDDDSWIYEWFGITHTAPNGFRKSLKEHKSKNITVWIDSWGGDVFAAAGIYNALKEHKGKVTAKIDGKAVSAASVIAMAADEVLMSPVGIMMIHNPWTWTVGEAKDMRKAADVMDEVKETIMNAYQAKTGKDRQTISDLMDEESWMSAKKAMNEGFVDGELYTEEATSKINNAYSLSGLAIQNSANMVMQRLFEQLKKHGSQNKTEDIPQVRVIDSIKKRVSVREKQNRRLEQWTN